MAAGVQSTKGEIVEELGGLLTEAGMQNVLPLPKARVPVVKFVVGENGTKVGHTGHSPGHSPFRIHAAGMNVCMFWLCAWCMRHPYCSSMGVPVSH